MLLLERIKHVVGYPESLAPDQAPGLVHEAARYGLGKARQLSDYMEMVGVSVADAADRKAWTPDWCTAGDEPPVIGRLRNDAAAGGGGA